jgi:glucose-6-phosphate dehydrogenase assembly protein OpcA
MHGPDGIARQDPPALGEPILRWSSRTNTLAGIEAALAQVWTSTSLTTTGADGAPERRVAARTSVLNLVVIARQPELGEHAGSVIRMLTGRHPSRTIIVSSADPDGPPWLDARVQAECVLPRADAPETCAEFIDLVAGGETGRHVAAIVAPLLIHDLPVTLWWPGDPPLTSAAALDLLGMSDRLVVDGAHWSGDGLDRLRALATIVNDHDLARGGLAVSDFAMLRQSRWREAIASSFDRPELRPFLADIRSITVRYAQGPGAGAADTNVIKPLYHVAWLASRLGMEISESLAGTPGGPEGVAGPAPDGGRRGTLLAGRRRVAIALVPVASTMPPGTTLAVQIDARRLRESLSVAVTAEAEAVIVRTAVNGRDLPTRRFMAPRRTEVELLAETIESVGRDPVAVAALLMASALAGPS